VRARSCASHLASPSSGLVVSQMLTLFTTPVIYLYLDRLRHSTTVQKPTYQHRPGILVPGGIAESSH
jgi:hypothetical protein